MILTEPEIAVVNIRLKKYRKLYREIFEELYDHILSLIEIKRQDGDNRDIAIVLKEVIDVDFEGDRGLHRIALQRFTLFRAGLWRQLWEFIRQYTILFWVLVILMLSAIYFVPYFDNLNIAFTIACFVMASIPLGYLIYIKGFKGVFYKGSVKLSTIGTYAVYPLNMFTVVFFLPFAVTRLVEGHARHGSVYISGAGLICFLTYTAGFIQFCNNEIKTKPTT
jgi:hypothetical protein